MSSFSRLIITDVGKELLNTSLTTGKKIVFTNAVTSDEKYTIDDLKELSELQAIQCVPLKNVNVEENYIKMSIEFDNADLMEGYLLQTLGVYAKLEDSVEVLFATSKEETENTYIPSRDVTASGLSIKLTIYLENTENVEVNIDPAGVATMGDVLTVENSLNAHINDTVKHITSTERNAWNQTYEQGTAYTDQKIADLINGAPETLDTIKEVADAIQENESVVEALDEAIGKKANQAELDTHIGNEVIHVTSTEKSDWNNAAAPSFTETTELIALTSKEKISIAFGKIAKAVRTLISHVSLIASSSVRGHVKLSNSSAITTTGEYALDATEKNASIEGTMAYDIANCYTKEQIKSLLSSSNERPTLVNSTDFMFLGSPVIIKNGEVATLSTCVQMKKTYTARNPVLLLPSGFRGTISNMPCIVAGSSSGVTGATQDENGYIRLTSDLAANTYVLMNIVYQVSF